MREKIAMKKKERKKKIWKVREREGEKERKGKNY